MNNHFISYSRNDSSFARQLTSELRNAGVDIWIDTRNIKAGRHWDQEVQDALDAAHVLILLLSPHSVISENVQDEVSYARSQDKEIIPILISPCKVPMRWARIHYIDFTQDYANALGELLLTLGIPAADTAEEPEFQQEHQLWQSARKRHNTEAYLEYLKKYASGRYTAEAHAFLLQLKEEEREQALWQEACSEDTVPGYEYYLSESSLQTHRAEAEKKIDKTVTLRKISYTKPVLVAGLFALALIVFFIWKPGPDQTTHKSPRTGTESGPALYMRQNNPVIVSLPPLLQRLPVPSIIKPFLIKTGESPATARWEDWFSKNNLALNYYNNGDRPAPESIPRSYKGEFELIGGGIFPDCNIFWYGTGFDQVRYLLITDAQAEKVLYFLDFGPFIQAGGQRGIRWAELTGRRLYFSQYGPLGGNSSFDCRITAIDLPDNEVLWTSADRTANSDQFLVKGSYIFSGYGQDGGECRLYLLDRNSGIIAQSYLMNGPVELIGSNKNNYYVRTGSVDLVYILSTVIAKSIEK